MSKQFVVSLLNRNNILGNNLESTQEKVIYIININMITE